MKFQIKAKASWKRSGQIQEISKTNRIRLPYQNTGNRGHIQTSYFEVNFSKVTVYEIVRKIDTMGSYFHSQA